MIITESEFKGNPMLVLKRKEDDKFPFQFGIGKAKMILESLDAIRAFVEKFKDFKKEKSSEGGF